MRKRSFGDLVVGEEEQHALLLDARLVVHGLQVILEVVDAVRRRDHDLDDRVAADERGEARERLLARAADADEQRVAALVGTMRVMRRRVLHRVLEEHEVHHRVHLVVLVERVLEPSRESRPCGDLVVHLVLDVLRKWQKMSGSAFSAA